MLTLGGGWTSVVVVRVVFVVLCLLAGAATVGLIRALVPERRVHGALAAAVVLSSPVMLYLGFKTLSEVPSLLWVVTACWAFAAGLERTRRARAAIVALAVAALALGTLTRVTGLLGFVSFVVALPLLGDPRFGARRAWGWALAVLAAHAIVVGVTYWWWGITPDRLRALAQSVTGRTQGAWVAVYAIGLTLQGAGLLAVLGFRWPLPGRQRFALAWAALGIGPYLLSASYLEPRFFYLTVPAVAMLAYDGLERVSAWFASRRAGLAAACGVLALVTLVDRLVFLPLMPFELDERAYRRTMGVVEERFPGGTVLAPWLSDFCYLNLSLPGTPVVLTFSRTYGTGRVFSTAEFAAWAGASSYAGTAAALQVHPRPWKYVGWTYNPSVLRVQDRLHALGVLSFMSPEAMGLLNHLAASWIWSSPDFVLSRVRGTEPYQAFLVHRASEPVPR